MNVRFIQDNYTVARCAGSFRVKYILVLYCIFTKYITQIVLMREKNMKLRRNMKFFNVIRKI